MIPGMGSVATTLVAGVTDMKIAQAGGSDPSVAIIYDPTLAVPTAQFNGATAQAKAAGGSVGVLSTMLTSIAPGVRP